MFNWLREFLEITSDYRERKRNIKLCESCETLRMQLAIANDEKKSLLNRLLEKPKEEQVFDTTDLKPILPRRMNWDSQRKILEANSRKTAQILKERSLEINKISTEDLEAELDLAATERENQGVKNAS